MMYTTYIFIIYYNLRSNKFLKRGIELRIGLLLCPVSLVLTFLALTPRCLCVCTYMLHVNFCLRLDQHSLRVHACMHAFTHAHLHMLYIRCTHRYTHTHTHTRMHHQLCDVYVYRYHVCPAIFTHLTPSHKHNKTNKQHKQYKQANTTHH